MGIRNVLRRVFLGVLLGCLIIVSIEAPPWVFYLLISLIIGIGVTEYFMIQPEKMKSGYFIPTMVFSLFFPAYFYFDFLLYKISLQQIFLVFVLILCFRTILTRCDIELKLTRLKNSLLILFILGFFFSYQINLRLYDGGGELAKDLLFYLYGVIAAGDSMAYFIGSTIGKRKLAPQISPKKTVEGSIAGLSGNIIAAIAAYYLFLDSLTLQAAIVGSIIIGITAQFGDLLESVLKRSVKVKDSSGLLAGHGGVLDRIDSLILASPVLYLILDLLRQV